MKGFAPPSRMTAQVPTGPVPITRTIRLPLYYTGLTTTALVRVDGGSPHRVQIARDYTAEFRLTIPAGGMSWLTLE